MVKVVLFGGTGGCGSAFLQYALDADHSIVLQARTPSKVTIIHEKLKVVQGDSTSAEDVLGVCEGCDVAVCCVGAPEGSKVLIMESTAKNIVAACKAHSIGRCYFITSLGIGGSSPTIRCILTAINGGDKMADFEAADEAILDAGFTAIRPDGLSDSGEPSGKYNATAETGMGMGMLHKSDVGLFICDEITKNEWSGNPVQIYKKKGK